MASYTTNLKNWGATGTEHPDGYNYLEGEQPVDEWDNWVTDQMITDVKDHLVPLTNSRVETDYGAAGGEPGTPEASHIYHDQGNERLELWDAAASSWRDLMFRDGDTMTGALDMGNYPISGVTSFEADSQVLLDPTSGSLTDGGSVNSNTQVLRGYYDSDGTTSVSATSVDATLQHVANSDGSSVLDAQVQATDVIRAHSSGNVEIPSGNLRLATGQSIEDDTAQRRIRINSSATRIYDSTDQAIVLSSSRHGINAFDGKPFDVYDANGAFTALEYITASSAPGTLELTNTYLDLSGQQVVGMTNIVPESGSILFINTDGTNNPVRITQGGTAGGLIFEANPGGLVRIPNGNLRLATGQSIEDRGGTNRFTIDPNATRVVADDGQQGYEASSSYERIHTYSGKPLQIRDNEGGFNAVQYDTDTSAGVLRTPNAIIRAETVATPSSGVGTQIQYDTSKNQGLLQAYDAGNSTYKDLKIDGQTIKLSPRSGLVDLSVNPANLRLATGQSIEDGGGTRRFEGGSGYTTVFDDSGAAIFEAQDGTHSRIYAKSAQPAEIYDREGAFTAVKYLTSASAPGTLELTNAKGVFRGYGVSRNGDLSNVSLEIYGQSVGESGKLVFSTGASGAGYEEAYIRNDGTGEIEAVDDAGNATILT